MLINRLIPILFIVTGLFGSESGTMRRTKLFKAGTNGYYTYRIPSLAATDKGTLLAFCAARKNRGGDWDPIDIMMRRSTDYGNTWEPPVVLAHQDSLLCDNAVPVVDLQTGAVHLLYQIDYARVYYRRSDDDGMSFSPPVEITRTLNKFKKVYPWVVVAPGPGHGIQMRNGRLVVPFWISDGGSTEFGPNHRGHRPSIVVSVYSDDHGQTWQAGEVAVPDNDVTVIPNETSVIQLTDGRVMFNSRNESINYRRLVTYSDDGATNWTEPRFHDAFFEPICFGSMVRFSMKPYQSKNRILFCNPDSRHDPWIASRPSTPRSARSRHRVNLTMRLSYDEGLTWPVLKVLDPEIAGYSDLAVTPDGTIHCFYEGGSLAGSHYRNTHMSVLSFDLNWLTDGQDNLDENEKPLIRINPNYNFLPVDQLPEQQGLADPFLMYDGSRVKTHADWKEQRHYLKAMLAHYQYGSMPHRPKTLVVHEMSKRDVFNGAGTEILFTITITRHEKSLDLHAGLIKPRGSGPFPIIIKNDRSLFPHDGVSIPGQGPPAQNELEMNIAKEVIRRGYMICKYVRTDLAPDDNSNRRDVGVFPLYPEYDWAAIAAWAWGYQLVIDAVNQMALLEMDKIVVTGHSRGGKAALCGAIYDDRIAIAAPNSSGTGGTGSLGYFEPGQRPQKINIHSDRHIHWWNSRFLEFADNESRLPFDSHFNKALIAPRALINPHALHDYWANPYGTQLTHQAAEMVFEWLNVYDHIGLHWRLGGHAQNMEDWSALLDFTDQHFFDKKISRKFNELPYPDAKVPVNWRVPETDGR